MKIFVMRLTVALVVLATMANWGDAVHHAPLSVTGEKLVTIHYEPRYGVLQFNLCNASACSALWAIGPASPNEPMCFEAFADCNGVGDECKTRVMTPKTYADFEENELVFVVKRLPTEMAVWRVSDPSNKGVVPVDPTYTTLRVAPSPACDVDDMRVESSDLLFVSAEGRTVLNSRIVGRRVLAKLRYRWHYRSLLFEMCGPADCRVLRVHAIFPGGELGFESYAGCKSLPDEDRRDPKASCLRCFDERQYGAYLPTGWITFALERRSDGLSVWLHGQPEPKRVHILAGSEYDRLRVLLENHPADTSDFVHDRDVVQFEPYTDACNDHQFHCGDGQCVSLVSRCDGFKDCKDGEDENSCDAANVTLVEGVTVTARVEHKEEHGGFVLVFCNDAWTSCSHIRIINCPTGWGLSAHQRCKAQGAFCYVQGGALCARETAFPVGENVVKLKLLPEVSNSLQKVHIYVEDGSSSTWEDKAKAEYIGSGNRQLRIFPANWVSNMPVKFNQ